MLCRLWVGDVNSREERAPNVKTDRVLDHSQLGSAEPAIEMDAQPGCPVDPVNEVSTH